MNACAMMLVLAAQPFANGWAEPPVSAGADAIAIVREVDRISQTEIWPGFDPRKTPMVFYDGTVTVLVGLPAEKRLTGFERLKEQPEILVYSGRHPGVSANTCTQIEGVPAASLMLTTRGKRSLAQFAGIAVHEAFHVFQAEHKPAWRQGNEATLFTYPFDNAEVLSLRRQESETLRRALTGSGQVRDKWAAAACEVRRIRFSLMPEDAKAYERGVEYGEGLAHYVEIRSTGQQIAERLGSDEFPADKVRDSCYVSGAAFAILLDAYSPGWKDGIERGDRTSLDELLFSRVGKLEASQLEPEFVAEAKSRAEADVQAVASGRILKRREFLESPGWTIVITSQDSRAFGLQGFDPLNVSRLSEKEILHTRMIKLGEKELGTIEMMNGKAITEAAGAHPLFGGVRRITISGIPDEPEISTKQGDTLIAARELRVELHGAIVKRDEASKAIVVRVGDANGRP